MAMSESGYVPDRYARQVALPDVGRAGQQRIGAASVLVVGAGGLGCAVLPYLCAAGVGRLIVVDNDCVEESNLHRQPLYRVADLGQRKAQTARTALTALNPNIEVEAVCERLTPANAASLMTSADVVVDAADSFAVTYVLNDECVRSGRPLVSASVIGLSGYVGAFCGRAPSYRAVFPELSMQAGTCATSGVLGTAVGVVGTLQAQIVLSLLLGLKPDVAGRLVAVDFRSLRFSGFSFLSAQDDGRGFRFISRGDVAEGDITVDLRGVQEAPTPAFTSSLRVSVEQIESITRELAESTRIVLCCRTGLRAWRAASRLRAAGHDNVALLAIGG